MFLSLQEGRASNIKLNILVETSLSGSGPLYQCGCFECKVFVSSRLFPLCCTR